MEYLVAVLLGFFIAKRFGVFCFPGVADVDPDLAAGAEPFSMTPVCQAVIILTNITMDTYCLFYVYLSFFIK